jgi:hypothetical protein
LFLTSHHCVSLNYYTQHPILGRSDVPTQDTTYTTHIIISPKLFIIPQKELIEHPPF